MFHGGEQMRFLSAEIDAVLDSTTRPGAVGLGYQLISDPAHTETPGPMTPSVSNALYGFYPQSFTVNSTVYSVNFVLYRTFDRKTLVRRLQPLKSN